MIIIGPGGHLIGGDYAFTQRPGHGGILSTATGQAFYYPDFHYVGPDFFRYTLSDGVCTSLQATVTINVADLEPPQIFCPTNFGMEFLGATGAPVNFLVGAWDTLSPASVRCVPPSGTVFPMGETTVQCVATDRSGNSNSCGFTVTILGARAVKERVLAEIAAFSTNTTATSDRQHLDKITRFLTAATNSSFWIDDSHLVTHFGRRVFRFEKYAAYYARLLIRADHGPVPDATAMDWKSRLLKVDRLLAEIAVNEAAERNVEARKITRCREIISRGDVKAAADRTGLAIDYYRNAWNRAIHLHGKPAH